MQNKVLRSANLFTGNRVLCSWPAVNDLSTNKANELISFEEYIH